MEAKMCISFMFISVLPSHANLEKPNLIKLLKLIAFKSLSFLSLVTFPHLLHKQAELQNLPRKRVK